MPIIPIHSSVTRSSSSKEIIKAIAKCAKDGFELKTQNGTAIFNECVL